MAKSGLRRTVQSAAVVVFWLLIWQLIAVILDNQIVLVTPLAAGDTLLRLLWEASFWETVGNSTLRISTGFVAAVTVGSVLAYIATRSSLFSILLSPLIRAIRSIPVVSFVVLLLLWSDSDQLSISVSFLMVLPIVYSNVCEGISRRDQALDEMAAVFRFSATKRWWAITFPRMLPYLIAAARVSLGLSWKAGVSAEVIGLASGSIGERIYQAKIFLSSAELFAWTAVVVALSYAIERVILAGLRYWERQTATFYSRSPKTVPTLSAQSPAVQSSATQSPTAQSSAAQPPATQLPAAPLLIFEQVSKSFGDQQVLKDFCLQARNTVWLQGVNGIGKTTVLRLALGTLTPDSGNITGNDQPKAAVFQENRLLPHLNTVSNIRLARTRPITNAEISAELTTLGLDDTAQQKPVRELSGGQQRRVAIARALLADAQILTLDEPFTGIDADTRPQIAAHIWEHASGRTVLLIAHDLEATELPQNISVQSLATLTS